MGRVGENPGNEVGTGVGATSFPGFSPTRPFGARERERPWLVPREESFVSQFFCLVRFHRSRNDRKGKTDLLSLQL